MNKKNNIITKKTIKRKYIFEDTGKYKFAKDTNIEKFRNSVIEFFDDLEDGTILNIWNREYKDRYYILLPGAIKTDGPVIGLNVANIDINIETDPLIGYKNSKITIPEFLKKRRRTQYTYFPDATNYKIAKLNEIKKNVLKDYRNQIAHFENLIKYHKENIKRINKDMNIFKKKFSNLSKETKRLKKN